MKNSDNFTNKIRVLTITSNDLGISYGPAVHYLELWNEICLINPRVSIEGLAPTWTGSKPIIDPKFPINFYSVRLPKVRQIFWDLICASVILISKQDVVYIRNSSFHFFTLVILKLRKKIILAVELNGLAVPDAESNGKKGFATLISSFCERGLIKRAQIIFSVTKKIEGYAKSINLFAIHTNVENGVSDRFFLGGEQNKTISKKMLTGIYVGTFTAWDGAGKICQIAAANPNISFLMVGDGGIRKKVEANAPKNMIFIGWIDYKDLVKHYAISDFAIVLYENNRHKKLGSSPLKLREYLAAGLPIFTSAAEGTEIVEEFGVGYRSESGDLSDFSDFISRITQYKERYSCMMPLLRERISWSAAARLTLEKLLFATRRPS